VGSRAPRYTTAMSTVESATELDRALSTLTAALPELPADQLADHAATARAIAADTAGPIAALATSLARTLDGYQGGKVPFEGWGLVASSAHTLARALAEPAGGHAGAALVAARFELDSLMPGPVTAAPIASPDVPLTSLRRRS
jgi:hypothetical protein